MRFPSSLRRAASGAGRQNFERRVFSQEVATTSYITYAAEHADEIMKAVAAARADVVAKARPMRKATFSPSIRPSPARL